MDKYQVYLYVVGIAFSFVAIWLAFFFKLNLVPQYVPALINGITASLSVIVGFCGTIIGIMFRDVKEDDHKTRNFYVLAMGVLLLPTSLLFSTYYYLTLGESWFEMSVRTGLSGLISAFFVFITIVLYTVRRFDAATKKQSEKAEPVKAETDKPKAVESKPIPKETGKNDEEKKTLRTIYKNLRDDNWQRGQGIWIANSILITGSLFVVFQSGFESPLTYLVALMLVAIADFLHLTTDMVTAITYKQMEKIGHEVGLDEVKKNYELDIKNKPWYPFRKGASYVLFSFLIAGYLFLWLNDLGLSVSMFFIILILNLVAIFYYMYFFKK